MCHIKKETEDTSNVVTTLKKENAYFFFYCSGCKNSIWNLSVFTPNTAKYGPEKADNFYAVWPSTLDDYDTFLLKIETEQRFVLLGRL